VRGVLDSSEARERLSNALVAASAASPTFVFQFADDGGVTVVPFRLLTPDAARSLAAELARWDTGESQLLRLLGRAYSFDARELFWDAANEYRAAFEVAGSCDLLNEAIAASSRAGDDEQVRGLVARRASLSGCTDRFRGR
jgi:hypothetical protein